jgi:hypothetical protein
MRQRSMRRHRNRSLSERIEKAPKVTSNVSWLEKRMINVIINSFGAAIPLTLHNSGTFLPADTTTVPAFLFSIASIRFKTRFGEAGDANVSRFAFQFLQQYEYSTIIDSQY